MPQGTDLDSNFEMLSKFNLIWLVTGMYLYREASQILTKQKALVCCFMVLKAFSLPFLLRL